MRRLALLVLSIPSLWLIQCSSDGVVNTVDMSVQGTWECVGASEYGQPSTMFVGGRWRFCPDGTLESNFREDQIPVMFDWERDGDRLLLYYLDNDLSREGLAAVMTLDRRESLLIVSSTACYEGLPSTVHTFERLSLWCRR